MTDNSLELRTASRLGKFKKVTSLASQCDINYQEASKPTAAEIKQWKKFGSEVLESESKFGEDIYTEAEGVVRSKRANLGWTALHLACQFGHEKVVGFLLEQGADVNATNRFGETPLHSLFLVEDAERSKNWDLVARLNILNLLISAGVDYSAEDINGSRPLNLAIRIPLASNLTFPMVAAGATANQNSNLVPNDWLKGCFLRKAVFEDNSKLVKKLLRNGVDPSSQDVYRLKRGNGRNDPFEGTSSLEQEYILGKDVYSDLEPPPHNRASVAWTPLHIACLYGKLEMVRTLLNASANPNAINVARETPLHALFLEHDDDLPDSFDETVREKILTLLLRSDVDIDAKDYHGLTPLCWACWRPNAFASVAQLLNFGADPTVKSKTGNSPLHICAEVGGVESAKLLIETGQVNVNRKLNGKTALEIAKQEKQNAVCELLVAAGAKSKR